MNDMGRRFTGIHLLLWLLLAILSVFLAGSIFGFPFALVKIPVVYGFAVVLFYVNYSYLIPRYYAFQRYMTYSILSIIVILLVAFARIYVEEELLADYLKLPTSPNDDLLVIRYVISSAVIYGLGFVFKMASNWVFQERERFKIQALKNETELKILKNQLRPHFLFNSINNIYSIAVVEQDKTAPMLLEISEMLRYLIYKTDKEWILIEDEIHFLNTLIKLYALRYESVPFNEITVKGKMSGYKIPPLIFLPFIENIFKHSDFEQLDASWKLSLSLTKHKLKFETQNPINKTNHQKETESGIGLSNVEKRLHLLFPDNHSIIAKKTEDTFSAVLELNLHGT